MTVRNTLRRGVVATLLAAAATVGLGTAPAQAEPFHRSHMIKAWTPWNNPASSSPQYWTIRGGSPVSMECWTTGAHREGTAKWFRVRSHEYPFTRGYVPANVVGNQWRTSPHC